MHALISFIIDTITMYWPIYKLLLKYEKVSRCCSWVHVPDRLTSCCAPAVRERGHKIGGTLYHSMSHPAGIVSYPDPNVRNDDIYKTSCYTVSDNHRYVHLGLGTRKLRVVRWSGRIASWLGRLHPETPFLVYGQASVYAS